MAKIEWNDDLVTGIEDVDRQHRILVDIYNDLDAAVCMGRGQKEMKDILDRLIAYTTEHFKFEEGLMAEGEYPGFQRHRIGHQQLLDKVRRFQDKLERGQERISKPVMKFLNFWLCNHIMHSDRDFGEFTRTRADQPAASV
jgi:hemerythrin